MDETQDAAGERGLPLEAAAVMDDRRGMMIYDGHGGRLWLDLSSPALAWLADACRRLIWQDTPPGASMLKVRAASQVYLVSRREGGDGGAQIRLANLFDPGEHVTLSCDLAEMVAALIEQATQQAARQEALA